MDPEEAPLSLSEQRRRLLEQDREYAERLRRLLELGINPSDSVPDSPPPVVPSDPPGVRRRPFWYGDDSYEFFRRLERNDLDLPVNDVLAAAAGGAVNNGLQRYTQAYRELLQEEPRGGLLGLFDLIRGN